MGTRRSDATLRSPRGLAGSTPGPWGTSEAPIAAHGRHLRQLLRQRAMVAQLRMGGGDSRPPVSFGGVVVVALRTSPRYPTSMSHMKRVESPSQPGPAGMQKPRSLLGRIAVIGGRGMLGSALSDALRALGVQSAILDLPDFDVCRESDLAETVRSSGVVINCAAYTNVDRAEIEPELAHAVNAHAVGVLGRLAAEHGTVVLHVSTDFVFDGTLDRSYSERDEPCPLSVYGASKLAGERSLAASGCASLVVRLQWTYGAGGANFITKCVTRGRESRELRVVSDQIGSPTWTRDAAVALIDLLETGKTGLFHYAARGYAGRSEVAEFALRRLGVDCRVIPCRTDEFPTPARRPLNSRFNCDKVDEVLCAPRPTWQDSLSEFLDQTREGAI